jgi:hypothetical protein
MHFTLSLSWFLVLAAFIIMCWCAYKTPAGVGRMTLVAWACFFLSILTTGFVSMSSTGH